MTTYVHPASAERDHEAAAMHATAARDAHAAGQLHDTSACGQPHRVRYGRLTETALRTLCGAQAGAAGLAGPGAEFDVAARAIVALAPNFAAMQALARAGKVSGASGDAAARLTATARELTREGR